MNRKTVDQYIFLLFAPRHLVEADLIISYPNQSARTWAFEYMRKCAKITQFTLCYWMRTR